MKKTSKKIFCCQNCGYQAPKWLGKCPECGNWDTFIEELQVGSGGKKSATISDGIAQPVPLNSITVDKEIRLLTGINEFDRVLGGGLVAGTLVLIGGDPGIGKSTLMLQSLHKVASKGFKVLYISGEESIRQIKLRSDRISSESSDMLVFAEIDLESVIAMAEKIGPHVLVIDSIQTMFNSDISSAPGSISQVRESTMRLMILAKRTGISIFLVGHVTKDGAIAGPRIMEHMVDTVLYFEGDRNNVFRILRAVKNRFGSTNEIGVFEMKDKGLEEVSNPSALFLAEKPNNAPGSVVTASMEGTRPILIEIQGLASSSTLGTPRRTILGLDQNRVALLVAVIEKKLGIHLVGHDIFMNVAGGVKVIEPAIDIGIVVAIVSSFLDKPISNNIAALGEIGLTGEVRAISHAQARVSEIKKMGFTHCIIPQSNVKQIKNLKDIKVTGIKSVAQAMEIIFE